MCAYPTKYFQTGYLKHAFFLFWPYNQSQRVNFLSQLLEHQNQDGPLYILRGHSY